MDYILGRDSGLLNYNENVFYLKYILFKVWS